MHECPHKCSCLPRLPNHTQNVPVRELECVLEARAADIHNLRADMSPLGVAGGSVSTNVFDQTEQMILKLLHVLLLDDDVVVMMERSFHTTIHTHTHIYIYIYIHIRST